MPNRTFWLALTCLLAAQAQAAAPHSKAAPSPSPAAAAEGGADKHPWIIENTTPKARHKSLGLSLGAFVDSLSTSVLLDLPLIDEGLVDSINDAFDLELSASFLFGRGRWWNGESSVAVLLGAGVRWDFYLTDAWAVFATLKLQVHAYGNDVDPVFVYPALGLGGLYRLGKVAQLRLEVGNPFGLSLGLAFDL